MDLLCVQGAATTQQLRAAGMSREQIARSIKNGQLGRRLRGTFTLPTPKSHADRYTRRRTEHLREIAAVHAAIPDVVVAFRSAALCWELPVCEIPVQPEVIRAPSSARLSSARTVRTTVPQDQLVRGATITATSLERTCVDLALDLPTPEALITIDAALARGGLREAMTQILGSRAKVRGCRRAEQTLQWADRHAESAFESRSRGELLLLGVPVPECNVVLELNGQSFRVDLYWGEFGIVGEADGRLKYQGRLATSDTLWKEKLRQEWLESEAGLIVVRWNSSEMRWAPHGVADRWFRAYERRMRQPWVPPKDLISRKRPG